MKFRDREAIGWKILYNGNHIELQDELNKLMEQYDFLDCQYSTHVIKGLDNVEYTVFSALVLLGEKDETN